MLAASYLDCCDGEVARVKLLSSRFGAWIDTSSTSCRASATWSRSAGTATSRSGRSYFGDLGFDPWQRRDRDRRRDVPWSIYCIYYNIIVAVGSANSQDYVGRFEVVPGGAAERGAARACRDQGDRDRSASCRRSLKWLATYVPYIVRRDFISWAAVALAALH